MASQRDVDWFLGALSGCPSLAAGGSRRPQRPAGLGSGGRGSCAMWAGKARSFRASKEIGIVRGTLAATSFMDNGRARADLIEPADTIDFSLVSPHLGSFVVFFFRLPSFSGTFFFLHRFYCGS